MNVENVKPLDSKRSIVQLEDGTEFALYNRELRDFCIEQNSQLDSSVLEQLENLLKKRARLRALNLLKDRDYTRKKLELKLQEGHYTAKAVSEALDYAKHYGYLDDERYAYNYIFSHGSVKSKKYMYNILLSRGISREDIDAAYESWSDSGEKVELNASAALAKDHDMNSYVSMEEAALYKALIKKVNNLEKLKDMDYKEKLSIYSYLARKGFEADLIRKVIDRYVDSNLNSQ